MHWTIWVAVGLGALCAVIFIICVYLNRQERKRAEAILQRQNIERALTRSKRLREGGPMSGRSSAAVPNPYRPEPLSARAFEKARFNRDVDRHDAIVKAGGIPLAQPTNAERIRENIRAREERRRDANGCGAPVPAYGADSGFVTFHSASPPKASPAPAYEPPAASQHESSHSSSSSYDGGSSSGGGGGGGGGD